MKFITATILSLISLAAAQNLSGEPPCATACLSSAITAAGCAPTDVACQCSPSGQQAVAAKVAGCLVSACTNPADLVVAQSAGIALCSIFSAAEASLGTMSVTPTVTSTSAVASSTVTAVSTTTSVASSTAMSSSTPASSSKVSTTTITSASSSAASASPTTAASSSATTSAPAQVTKNGAVGLVTNGMGSLVAVFLAVVATL